MFYNYFQKIKKLNLSDINLDELVQKKIGIIDDKSIQNRDFFLKKLNKTLVFSLFFLFIFIVLIAISRFFEINYSNIQNQLNKYTNWHSNLPGLVSFFLPSVIINNFIFKKIYLLIVITLTIMVRIFIVIFQYHNSEMSKDDLFKIILYSHFKNSENIKIFDIEDFDQILNLPNYNDKFYLKKIYNIDFELGEGIITEVNLSDNNPQRNILSLIIAKIDLNFIHEDFKLNSSGIEQSIDLSNLDESKDINITLENNLINLNKCRRAISKTYFDNKIKNLFVKEKKLFDTNFPIKYITRSNCLFIIVPKAEELFAKRSLFIAPIKKSDIVLFNEFCTSITKILKIMKKNEKII